MTMKETKDGSCYSQSLACGGEVFVKDGPELFYRFPLFDCFLFAQEACTQKLVQQSFGLCNK